MIKVSSKISIAYTKQTLRDVVCMMQARISNKWQFFNRVPNTAE